MKLLCKIFKLEFFLNILFGFLLAYHSSMLQFFLSNYFQVRFHEVVGHFLISTLASKFRIENQQTIDLT